MDECTVSYCLFLVAQVYFRNPLTINADRIELNSKFTVIDTLHGKYFDNSLH